MNWFSSVLSALIISITIVSTASALLPQSVVISEIQTGSGTSTSHEFIELHNNSSQDVDLTGWKVQYKTYNKSSTKNLVTLQGMIEAHGFALLSAKDYMPADFYFSAGLSGMNTGAHIILVDSEDSKVDSLGWGSAQEPETESAVVAPAGSSLKRLVNADGLFVDTDNNKLDFSLSDTPYPQGGDIYELETVSPVENIPAEPIEVLPLLINELLPNPSTADSEAEYIELYNPNAVSINLDGYKLKTGMSESYSYILSDKEILAGGYLTLYSSETNLVLSNTAGKAALYTPNGDLLSESMPYENAEADQAWALIGDNWIFTTRVTPGEINVLAMDTSPESQKSSISEEPSLAPCPDGKFRNPETKRCKTITNEVERLTPCDSNQERNPQTNRCRAIGSGSVLAACQAGYSRNAETNRCRKNSSSESELKPCQSGYERNPSTNRCRKIVATPITNAASIGGANTAGSTPIAMSLQWWITGLAATGVLGYGIYEWRSELTGWYMKIRSAMTNGPPQ